MKSVIILSGGMDSTTLLYKLLAEGKEVHAISFNYGQRHSKELECAKATCETLGVSHKIIDITSITDVVSNSALTSSDIDVPEGHYAEENMKKTVVPNRNMIMASIAIGYAVNIGASEVALGIHAGDHAIYPDCRPEFVEALNAISQIANFEAVTIYAPYVTGVDKGDIVIEGIALGVDYSKTWTCYKGQEKPCGKCGSCMERLLAFDKMNQLLESEGKDVRVRDPVYDNKEEFQQLVAEAKQLDKDYNNGVNAPIV